MAGFAQKQGKTHGYPFCLHVFTLLAGSLHADCGASATTRVIKKRLAHQQQTPQHDGVCLDNGANQRQKGFFNSR